MDANRVDRESTKDWKGVKRQAITAESNRIYIRRKGGVLDALINIWYEYYLCTAGSFMKLYI